MTQTIAILTAGYRQLKARKLFWLAIVLSALVVAIFAIFGMDERGITVWPFGWSLESPFFNSNTIPLESFYKTMYWNFGVMVWLGFGATILALIASAGIVPELVSAGAIDAVLARPISRTRLLLTTWATGLLFTALQVCVFSLASFLVIGLRGGVWEWGLFLAVPVMLVYFSYLFGFCALVGVLTRSTIASLLLTGLFWMLLMGIHGAEAIVAFGRTANEMEREAIARMVAEEKAKAEPDEGVVEDLETELVQQTDDADDWIRAHDILWTAKLVLPKPMETAELGGRWIGAGADMPGQRRVEGDPDGDGPGEGGRGDSGRGRDRPGREIFGLGRVERKEFERRMDAADEAQGFVQVIGSSLLCEAALLALACWAFSRQDF